MTLSFTTPSNQSQATATIANRLQAFVTVPRLRALLLGTLLMGSAGAAMAQGTPSAKAKQSDAQSLSLTIENPAQQRVEMQVVSLGTKRCVLREVNHNLSYGCKLNFQDLSAGQYAVLLRVGQKRYRYTVQVQAPTPAQNTISVPELTAASATPSVAAVLR